MGLFKLRLSMLGTLALLIGFTTLVFTVFLSLAGALNIVSLIFLVLVVNILQWLFAPMLIDAMYNVREMKESEHSRIFSAVRAICQRTKIQMPKLMMADMDIANAFAYGSPLSGKKVVVTKGLLDVLEHEEVEAVLGHELGHLKHRDVQVMMFASVLPAIFYYIGQSIMLSSMYGYGYRRDRNAGAIILVGIAAMVIYLLMTLLVLGLGRLREYYADQHGVQHVPDGARKLSEALAKITLSSARVKLGDRERGLGAAAAFKTLFISDPDRASKDAQVFTSAKRSRSDQDLVRELLSVKVTVSSRLVELLSTHPNITKRLRALQHSRASSMV